MLIDQFQLRIVGSGQFSRERSCILGLQTFEGDMSLLVRIRPHILLLLLESSVSAFADDDMVCATKMEELVFD